MMLRAEISPNFNTMPQESRRQQKINRLIQKEISDIISRQSGILFGSALVTVTNVYITPDLLTARIYISIFNSTNPEGIPAILEEHKKEFRKELGNRLRFQLRRIPDLEDRKSVV